MKIATRFFVYLALMIGVHAQAPPRDNVAPAVTGIARITGRVVTADTRNPIARAQVQISSTTLAKPRQVTTDADGR